jgi:hypothetical protein
MDNEKLEIVNNEGLTEAAEVAQPSMLKTALPIVGGAAAACVGGYLLYRFVIKPMIAKSKAKKAEQATPAEEPKAGEES